MKNKKNVQRKVNVEFGEELGDINSAKIYEVQAQTKNKHSKKEKNPNEGCRE